MEDYETDLSEAFTYTLTKSQAARLCSGYPELAAALREGVFLWLDGHLVLNRAKYIRYENSRPAGLSVYARCNKPRCCLSFRRVYAKYENKYIPGELRKERLRPIAPESREFTPEQVRVLRRALYEISEEELTLETSPSGGPFGAAVKHHMTRCEVTEDDVAAAWEWTLSAR